VIYKFEKKCLHIQGGKANGPEFFPRAAKKSGKPSDAVAFRLEFREERTIEGAGEGSCL